MPETEITEEPKTLNRQLPLYPEIRDMQKNCFHRLVTKKDSVHCVDCGAFWIR